MMSLRGPELSRVYLARFPPGGDNTPRDWRRRRWFGTGLARSATRSALRSNRHARAPQRASRAENRRADAACAGRCDRRAQQRKADCIGEADVLLDAPAGIGMDVAGGDGILPGSYGPLLE